MQEFVVSCRGLWWHFFHKPSYGLCFRKKDGAHFDDFEILLKESEEDFCVLSVGNLIHIVCQDAAGSILYLLYNGENWEKLVLLTSKEGKSTPKHFSLLPVGSHINLYYTIMYKEKNMLVHQLLNAPGGEPTVVDYITDAPCPYSVSRHSSGDLTLCYQNMQGVCGMRTFLWSQKSYQPFCRIPFALLSPPALLIDSDDTCHFAAVTELEGVRNLSYFRREADGSFSEASIIYLDCAENPQVVFFRKEGRLYLEWMDGGCVMMSYFSEEDERWKKPVKYMRNAATPVVLYRICEGGSTSSYYGFSNNGAVKLYDGGDPLMSPPKASPAPKYRPSGYEAAEFAKQFGYRPQNAEVNAAPEFLTTAEYQKEQGEIKQLLSKQNDVILELLRRISVLEDAAEHKEERSSSSERKEEKSEQKEENSEEASPNALKNDAEEEGKVVVTAK